MQVAAPIKKATRVVEITSDEEGRELLINVTPKPPRNPPLTSLAQAGFEVAMGISDGQLENQAIHFSNYDNAGCKTLTNMSEMPVLVQAELRRRYKSIWTTATCRIKRYKTIPRDWRRYLA